ncbi:uncharacterized protein UDID_04493 [Ustilago sp. UG-2017a]|nr:uncharacterized protein UDID_04493 [Ustilago sp. UG-2017a]
MPVRQRGGAGSVARPCHGLQVRYGQDVKPKIKPDPSTNDDGVIDLCDSDDASESEDDFLSSSTSRRATKKQRSPSTSTSSSTAKLYAIARIVTLATDGVSSLAESSSKLASINSGILSRIQKSLALAKHPGTGEAEAQQALRLATQLMSSQNLTQADLLASSTSEANQSRAGMSIVEILSQTNACPRNESWVNQVAIAVNLFFDVKAYSTSYANRTKLSWTFYGLAVNTVAAAHAFEMVHNQVLTWAGEKARSGEVKGKTGKNSYCQGLASGLIGLAKGEKKEELRKAIEGEKKSLRDADSEEGERLKKEKQRLRHPVVESGLTPEPEQDSGPTVSRSRNAKLEDVVDEEDVKPFRNGNGLKGSASETPENYGYAQWGSTDHPSASSDDDAKDQFYDSHPTPPFPCEEDIKATFDEALESDIIDLTNHPDDDSLDMKSSLPDVKPYLAKRDPDIKEEQVGAGWQSSNQLIRFRQDAEQIADDYLASQHGELKLKKRAKSTYRKDAVAFEQGRRDASKIDVKRKRIQG